MQVCGMTVKNYLPEKRLGTAMVLRFGNRRMLDGSITIEGEQCHFMLNLFVVGIDAVTHDSRDGTLVPVLALGLDPIISYKVLQVNCS